MATMEQVTSDFQSHIQSTSVPQPPQEVNFNHLAAQKVSQVPGLDPSQTQLATSLAALQIKAEHEARLARHLLEKSLMTTINTVNSHTQDISSVKQSVDTLQSGQADLERNQRDIYDQLHQIHSLAWKSYQTAAENKQRSSKGNFIVQGDHVPPYSPSEDLYAKLFPLIYQKYGIHVYPTELKALHRLPNGKILFTLTSRLPGQNFDNFTRLMNSNPNPNIKVFVTIQLFEPFAELYYIARRLKHYNVISNYRLDENGNSQIALSPTTQSFRFTSLEQLESLQVAIPAQVRDEIKYRRNQISQNEEKATMINNEKAHRQRPNHPSTPAPRPPQPQQNYSGPPTGRPPLSGSNTVPILAKPGVPVVPPPSRPNPGPQPLQYQKPYYPNSRTIPVKRPSPSPTVSPGHVIDLTTSQHPPPQPNQGQSPQLSFPPYPQSYWSTPPPGEGPPPPTTTGLAGSSSQSTGWATSMQSTELRGSGSQQQAGFTGRTLQSAGFEDYKHQEGYHHRWQY